MRKGILLFLAFFVSCVYCDFAKRVSNDISVKLDARYDCTDAGTAKLQHDLNTVFTIGLCPSDPKEAAKLNKQDKGPVMAMGCTIFVKFAGDAGAVKFASAYECKNLVLIKSDFQKPALLCPLFNFIPGP